MRGVKAMALFCLGMLSLSCAVLRPTPVPIPSLRYEAPQVTPSKTLAILLPGRRSGPESFARQGFVEMIQEARPTATIWSVGAHLGYYRGGSFRERMWSDFLQSARSEFDEAWLVGTSLGGLGALAVATGYPDEVEGVVLLAPYLGPARLLEEIEGAGGLDRWTPSASPDVFSRIWDGARRVAESDDGPRIYLGFGRADRLAPQSRALAEVLPGERVARTEGGHTWVVWRRLLEEFLAGDALEDSGR